MANEKENMADLTGLESATFPKDAEVDLLSALLKAADYKNDEDEVKELEIKRNGEVLFSFKIRPLTDDEIKSCRKKATTYMKNPNGKKLPPIEKEYDNVKFQHLAIYTATVEEDKKRIWGNKEFMDRLDLLEPWESVSAMLKPGERTRVMEVVLELSGMGGDDDEEEEVTLEDYARD